MNNANFWLGVVDFIFDLFSGSSESRAGRWFRDLEAKDGREPGSSIANKSLPTIETKRADNQGVLPIKVIK